MIDTNEVNLTSEAQIVICRVYLQPVYIYIYIYVCVCVYSIKVTLNMCALFMCVYDDMRMMGGSIVIKSIQWSRTGRVLPTPFAPTHGSLYWTLFILMMVYG